MIAVGMTDRDVIARAAAFFGVSFRESKNHRRQEHFKPFWRLEVTGERAAEWMRTLHPHMGERRQARISELLEMWATRRPVARAGRKKGSVPWNKGMSLGPSWNAGLRKDTCVNGHDMADALVTSGRRNCRECQRDRERRYREKRRARDA